VDDVILHKRGYIIHGSLHLTTHHLIFTVTNPRPNELKELWLCYPMISSVERKKGSALLNLLENSSINGLDQFESIDNDHNKDILQSKFIKNLPKLFNQNGKELNLFKLSTLKINCKDFNYLSFDFENETKCLDVFESIMKLTCLNDINQLYAFIYQPNSIERNFNTWNIYDPIKEFQRQGLNFTNNNTIEEKSNSNWRISTVNKNYTFSNTYPNTLVVPKTISDSVLTHASKYRSKQRIPALTFYYRKNGCSITRSSQPLVGLKQTRSIQDEKLIEEIFKSNSNNTTTSTSSTTNSSINNNTTIPTSRRKNLIVDARPTTNAMAQTALGAGSENMDNYSNCDKIYLGIDNIHVMRDSLNKLIDILKTGDLNKPKLNKSSLKKTNWLKYISILLISTEKLVKSIVLNNSNILIHCSDGWDRTSQISSLIQICIDPYYRTIQGFITLIEKDWISFGHRFNERSGHLSSESIFHDDSNDSNNNHASLAFKSVSNHFKKKKHLKFTSPIFHQFLDSIYQILIQFPDKFEFNERFLRRLIYHLYSCQYGNFLFDNEYERSFNKISEKTRSCWDYFLSRRHEFTNKSYSPSSDEFDWISPNFKSLKWWWQLYGRSDEEMNGSENTNGHGNGNANGNDNGVDQDLDGLELQNNGSKSSAPEKEDGATVNITTEPIIKPVSETKEPEPPQDQDQEINSNSKVFALTPPPAAIYKINANYNHDDNNNDNDDDGNDDDDDDDDEKNTITNNKHNETNGNGINGTTKGLERMSIS